MLKNGSCFQRYIICEVYDEKTQTEKAFHKKYPFSTEIQKFPGKSTLFWPSEIIDWHRREENPSSKQEKPAPFGSKN